MTAGSFSERLGFTESELKQLTNALVSTMKMYDKSIDKHQLQLWAIAIKKAGLNVPEAVNALSDHLINPDRGQFAPRISDVVSSVKGNSASSEIQAMIAWGKVKAAISSVGMYSAVCFDDSRINAALEMIGGWLSFSRIEEKEMPFIMNRFIKAYSASDGAVYPAWLKGIHGKDNLKLIGDPDAASLVYNNGNKKGLAVATAKEFIASAGAKSLESNKGIEND